MVIMMSCMRTTLTLDDDVAAKLREFARRSRLSFKEAVNSVLRRGLAAQERRDRAGPPFRVEIFNSPFRPGVDPVHLNQLVDELDVESFAKTRHPRARRRGPA